jgi:uncharacterized protein YndB with AHSA1/START domain
MNATASVTVARRIAAPPEALFDAWLDRECVGRWLFATPDGVMEKVEIDARLGGGFTIVERRGADLAEHFGEYVELDRPRRLAFDFWTSMSAERTRVTVTIEADGDGSLLTLRHDSVWADYEDRTRHGWTMILDGLARAMIA